jgi:hypothetical protein
MPVPWPDEAPEQWNRCELGGLELPGLAKVDIDLSEKLDVKKPQGGHGATITRDGYEPAKVSITLRMWEPAQFDEFQAIVPLLRPRVGGGRSPAPLAILHPKADLWGVKAVVLERISDRNGDRGDLYDVSFECIEHFPPPKTTATKTDKSTIGDFRNAIAATSPPMPSQTNRGPT